VGKQPGGEEETIFNGRCGKESSQTHKEERINFSREGKGGHCLRKPRSQKESKKKSKSTRKKKVREKHMATKTTRGTVGGGNGERGLIDEQSKS